MRGEKDEQMMNPMFPRLHVNDTEKGGPRAPPRNKMALYEQFSIPSQRSGSGSASILPLPPSKGPSFPLPTSSSNGGGQQSNNVFTPFFNPPASSFTEKRHSHHPLGGFSFSSVVETHEQNQPSVSLSTKSNSFQNSDIGKPFGRKPEDCTAPLPSQSSLFNRFEDRHLDHKSSPREQSGANESIDLLSRNCIREQISGKGDETTEKLKRQQKDCSAEGDGRSSKHGSKRQKSSSSASVLSPDDVVGIIGEKQFWVARRAIVNQQRDFAVQVFELHRIIKVQNLIARSPEILFEETLFFRKPMAPIPSKTIPTESKDNDPPRPEPRHPEADNKIAETTTTTTTTPTPSNIEITKEHVCPQPNPSENPLETPDAKSSDLWCFPPSGNQWLVPIVSPSEGLVYKPYAGPGPPNAGFVGPVFGRPMKVSFGADPTYFPPYGMPMMNSPVPNPFGESWLYGRESQLSDQVSQMVSQSIGKIPGPKAREIMEGSTGSCPSERPRRGESAIPLPLFPTSPTSNPNASQDTEVRRTTVIKVVPHNPKRATETAARIFQSIQEERKQCD